MDEPFSGPRGDLPPEGVIFGASAAMQRVRASVETAASANLPVLLQGQSGTGKEILAQLIHRRSASGDGPFVKVNCPGIPGTLLESELFGFQKGAFTGAHASKSGRVEQANRGTLFLDEIAELEPGLQSKLLQFLQDGYFWRIGGQKEQKIEARVICATNRQLEGEIEKGRFRQDLFYRINVLTIELPPLRQRAGDIPILSTYLAHKYSVVFSRPERSFSKSFLNVLQAHDWPGNIRELENVIKHYALVGEEEAIRRRLQVVRADPWAPEMPAEGAVRLKEITRTAIRQLERKIILQTLEAHGWNRGNTARALDISYGALLYKLKAAGIPSRRSAKRPRIEEAEPALTAAAKDYRALES